LALPGHGFDWRSEIFSEWENRSDTREFAADLNSGRVLFQKSLDLHYRASATELRSGEASSGRSDRGTKKGFVRNSGTETEERNRTCEFKDVVLE